MPPRARKTTVAKKAPAKRVAAKPNVTLDDLPKTIRDLVIAQAGGDITRIDVISHTVFIIRNPKD